MNNVCTSPSRNRLLFFVTEDWYFVSHRLPLAAAAIRAGYDVAVATRVNRHRETIEREGIRLFPIELQRSGRHPVRELRAIREITGIYRRWRPDIVHHIALKPVLYGGIAARLARVPVVVNALAGLGFAFDSESPKARMLRPAIERAYQWALNVHGAQLIVQNEYDRSVLIERRLVDASRVSLIRGAGVDTRELDVTPEPAGIPLVILPARMLRQKGIFEFAGAAKALKAGGVAARFALVGDVDSGSPASATSDELRMLEREGAVEWWGWQSDMRAVLAAAHIVCLPSYYREGVPKSLLEAAACGRPIVTCDMPGCRDVVRDGETGLLVAPRDVPALTAALRRLIEDPELRRQMGLAGRQLVEQTFSLDRVVAETLEVYQTRLEAAYARL